MITTRRVFGIGETVLDIIFKEEQPVAAKPGGSAFNAVVSLGRMGIDAHFISEVGNDKVGGIVKKFLTDNGVDNRLVNQFDNGKSALSLAFLNDKSDAEYQFYKDYPNQRLEVDLPELSEHDIVLFGSFFGLNPQVRPIVKSLLERAKAANAIIYYDPNFRATHLPRVNDLVPVLEENFSYASFVRGSDEDFVNIFGTEVFDEVYDRMKPMCSQLIITQNAAGVQIESASFQGHFPAKKIRPISTIGAGDNFNAGFIYALIRDGIYLKDIPNLTEEQWGNLIKTAVDFSSEVCCSYENYVSNKFVSNYLKTI